MADTKGQVDWGRVAAEALAETGDTYLEDVLRRRFEPLVKAARGLRDKPYCSGCHKRLMAALDRLPKVGG